MSILYKNLNPKSFLANVGYKSNFWTLECKNLLNVKPSYWVLFPTWWKILGKSKCMHFKTCYQKVGTILVFSKMNVIHVMYHMSHAMCLMSYLCTENLKT